MRVISHEAVRIRNAQWDPKIGHDCLGSPSLSSIDILLCLVLALEASANKPHHGEGSFGHREWPRCSKENWLIGQRKTFPRTDDVVVSYIAGLVDDEDEEVDDIVEMTRGMLQAGPSNADNQSLDDLYVLPKPCGNPRSDQLAV